MSPSHLDHDCPSCRSKIGEECWVNMDMSPPGEPIAGNAVTIVGGVWVHVARVQVATLRRHDDARDRGDERAGVSDTDEVLARGIAAAEPHVALIGYQLVALGGSVPSSPEKAAEFGRFVAVELAQAYVEGSTAQLAELADHERRRVREMEDLAAHSRQETADLERLTEETRRTMEESRQASLCNQRAMDDLLGRISALEETAGATRRLAQDLLAAYRRLAEAHEDFVETDLARRAAALGLSVRQEAP